MFIVSVEVGHKVGQLTQYKQKEPLDCLLETYYFYEFKFIEIK